MLTAWLLDRPRSSATSCASIRLAIDLDHHSEALTEAVDRFSALVVEIEALAESQDLARRDWDEVLDRLSLQQVDRAAVLLVALRNTIDQALGEA